MTNTQIPREAVDAAARALGNHIELDFDVLPADEQHQAREAAIAALNAAAPLIVAAELDRLIRDPKNFTPGGEFRATVLVKRIAELKSGVDKPAESAEPRAAKCTGCGEPARGPHMRNCTLIALATEPRRFSDPDVEPPADVKQLTDHTGDLLVRITDGTWLWARIGDAEYPILDDASDGYDWSDVANELTPGHAFIEATSPEAGV